MSYRRMKVIPGGKLTHEELKARIAMLRSHAKDLTCLRNEFRKIEPGEKYKLSEASIRALMRIRRKIEKYGTDYPDEEI